MSAFENWTVQVRKGVLELCILNSLAGEECYGYDLVKTLSETPGLGVSEGTIYPLLSRMRVQGMVLTRLVESAEGPARKYYSLTAEGRRNREMMSQYLSTLVAGCESLHKKRGPR